MRVREGVCVRERRTNEDRGDDRGCEREQG